MHLLCSTYTVGQQQQVKIPHTGDKASLDRCGQQHRCHRRVDQEYPKPDFFEKRKKSSKTQKLKNVQRYAKISDTPFESWFLVGPRMPKNPIFLKNKKIIQNSKLKNVQRYAKISDTPFDQRSLIHREAWFPPCFVRQNQQKKLFFFFSRGDFRPLSNKNVQMLYHFFPLLFPKDSESLKILDIRLREVGAKRPLIGTSKVNRRTNTQTHGQTDRQTDGHFDLQKASAQRADALKR